MLVQSRLGLDVLARLWGIGVTGFVLELAHYATLNSWVGVGAELIAGARVIQEVTTASAVLNY
jgi:hypothetical protein